MADVFEAPAATVALQVMRRRPEAVPDAQPMGGEQVEVAVIVVIGRGHRVSLPPAPDTERVGRRRELPGAVIPERLPMPHPLSLPAGTRRSRPARNGPQPGQARTPGWLARRARQAGSGFSAAQAGPRAPSICPGRAKPRPAATGWRPCPDCSPSLPSMFLSGPEPMGGEPASSTRVTAPEPWPGAAPVGSAPPGATDHA